MNSLLMTRTDDRSELNQTLAVKDQHSFANSDQVRVRHLDLDLTVHFDSKTIHGTAVLTVERLGAAEHLILDTVSLKILRVEVSADDVTYGPTSSSLTDPDPLLGSALTIKLPADSNYVRIEYVTAPDAPALQWFEPDQTAGKKRPFLLTQSQTIHARSWIPTQDSPQ